MSAIDFVKESCSEFNNEENRPNFLFMNWVNKYFDKESNAFKLMAQLETQYGSEMASRCGEMAIYTPQTIWLLGVIDAIEKDVLKEADTCKDSMKEQYPDIPLKDISDDENDILAIVGKVNGEWKYLGITKETMEKIFFMMASQLC